MLSFRSFMAVVVSASVFVPASFVAAQSPVQPPSEAPANAAAPAAALVVTSTPAPTNPRVAVVERISQAALQAMAASDDPVALVLSAKYARDANMKFSDKRSDAQKDDLQAAVLTRAKQLAEKNVTDKKVIGLVDIQIAMFCLGLPAKPVCGSDRNGVDVTLAFADNNPENATGWIIMAAREYAQGQNAVSQRHLAKAAKANTNAWYYKEALATALKYAKDVRGADISSDIKMGDAEAAAFELSGWLTLPPYKRFTQMCAPDPKGKLPAGRYPLCRKVAQLLVDQGETSLELFVGYKALERLATGEKKTSQAKAASAHYAAMQAAIDSIWKTKLKFPPQSDADGAGLVTYVADLIQFGEAKAIRLTLERDGKSVDDFLPKTSKATSKAALK